MTSKLLYQFDAPGLTGEVHKFEKPLFQSTMMFVGMALCMFVYYWEVHSQKQKHQGTADEERALLGNGKGQAESQKEKDWRIYYVVAVPAICDFLATYMMTVGTANRPDISSLMCVCFYV